LVYNRLVPWEAARPFLLACHARGLLAASEISGMHYANFNVHEKWPYITQYEIVDFSAHEKDAEKLYAVINGPDDIAFLTAHLPELFRMNVARDNLAMVNHRDATKVKAIRELLRRWNIKPEETAAFGDDWVDISLLEYAGIGIAMENALNEVKAAADEICLSNDADGVAEWLERRVLF
jgi:hydroxymethylpyrimidine pyrophosphatase-like HAD family hydrolase